MYGVQVQTNSQTREWLLASAVIGTQGGKLDGICSGMSWGTVPSEEFMINWNQANEGEHGNPFSKEKHIVGSKKLW